MVMTMDQPYTILSNVLLGTLISYLGYCFLLPNKKSNYSTNNDNSIRRPPLAKGGIPILGHALAYQTDPPAFLETQENLVGKICEINLAGRRMIIVGSDPIAMKAVCHAPESELSSKQAVANVGFEQTLGPLNVYHGTDCHKRVLKDEVYSHWETQMVSKLITSLSKSLDLETQPSSSPLIKEVVPNNNSNITTVTVSDVFQLVRRVVLRTSLDSFVSLTLLENYNEAATLLNEIMEFQDAVEDATAKAAVLPQWFALPFILKPVERKRRRLVEKLGKLLEPCLHTQTSTSDHKEKEQHGPWMHHFIQQENSPEDAANLVLGLMFAAHKNPSIAAAQAWTFAQMDLTKLQYKDALTEAQCIFHSHDKNVGVQELLQNATTLRRIALETLRLTSHSIGALRIAQKDLTIPSSSGIQYQIHKGDNVAVSHISSHRSNGTWQHTSDLNVDMETFCLDRPEWNVKNATQGWTCESLSDTHFTAFSCGVHKCPGQRISLLIIETIVALLLTRDATISLDETEIPPLSFERATLAQRDGYIPIQIQTNIVGTTTTTTL